MGKKSTGVKGAELARLWGVSRARVSQMKSSGMPLTSISDAEAWRSANYGGGGKKISSTSSVFRAARISAASTSKRDMKRKDAPGVLARAIQAEGDAWATYEERKRLNKEGGCTDAEVTSGLRLWNQAMETRLSAERELAKLEQVAGNLIDPAQARQIIDRKVSVLAGIVDKMTSWAARVNPMDPDHASEVLRGEQERIRELLRDG